MWTSMTKKEAVLSTTTGLGENKKSDWGALQVRVFIYVPCVATRPPLYRI